LPFRQRVGALQIALPMVLLAACAAGSGKGANEPTFAPNRILPYVVDVQAPMANAAADLSPDSVRAAANLVADWQVRHMDRFEASALVNFQGHRRYSFGGWLMGAMAIGMTRWGRISGDPRYLDFIRDAGRNFGWQLEARVFDADDYAIGQTYLELFELDGNPEMLAPLAKRLNRIYDNWPTVRRDFGTECERMGIGCRDRWTWIDAMFMGAPVWTHMAQVTGEQRYLEFADHEFWASFDTFWDADESLLHRDRRYLRMRDPNGHKVFWSRGNGWVFAAFARILPRLPKEHASRPRYIERFRLMAARLAELQQAAGYWTSSLTNAAISPTPETSGTAFFAYGLAWGINAGLLDREAYLPVVARAWSSLASSIYADGRLAYVQPSGSAPQIVHKESTDVYGVGAFLLAASEIYQLANALAAQRPEP